jgi:hypothetical protein
LFDAKTFSLKLPRREVKAKPAAPLQGTAGDWDGINEAIIGEFQSHIWESGNAAKLLSIEVKPLFSH